MAGTRPIRNGAAQVPKMTHQIIEVAKASGATVILPGNIYVYGKDAPEMLGPETPHLAQNPLGRVRVQMEAAYRASGVQTLVVRAGDYIDTEASGNWFDMIMAKKAKTGVFTVPGPLDCPRAYNFIPDVADTIVALAEKREALGVFEDVNAPGYTLTGLELAEAVGVAMGRKMKPKQMAWLPLRVLQPVWPLARGIVEMRYIWSMPHRLDQTRREALCPEVTATPLGTALRVALDHQINPNKAVRPAQIAAE